VGSADVFCAEYCGTRHAYMMTEVVVLEESEFRAWLATGGEPEPGSPGPVVVMERQGCLDCHSLDGTYDTGPTFLDLYGSTRTVERDGRRIEVTADEDYLRRAILEPGAELVVDFPPSMPPAPDLTPEQIDEIIGYLRELAGEPADGQAGGGR
jgi:cytochrome c oxidase subunit 2